MLSEQRFVRMPAAIEQKQEANWRRLQDLTDRRSQEGGWQKEQEVKIVYNFVGEVKYF